MTIWCNTCRRHVCAPCISHQEQEEDQRRSCSRRFRSTKGASKARRDHINHEIRNMRALLPISQEDRERLSYLHSMATICTYIRKSVFFQGLLPRERLRCFLPYEAFLQAVHGFILVTSAQGRLVYVSENVAEYLGISMVDVLQGDTFYDMVERSDIDFVKSNLQLHGENASPERSFVCCMQTSRAFKLQHGNCCSMLVRGSFRSFPQPCPSSSVCPPPEPLFVALCTPTVDRLRNTDSRCCLSFISIHRLDMRFTQLSDSALYFWGYSAEEMACRSWYSLIHPEDLSQSANSHRTLMLADEGFQVEMVLRLQCKDLSWTWIYTRANKDLECQGIKCINYIISETEAFFLKTKINKESISPLPPESNVSSCQLTSQQPQSCSTKCSKRQRMSNNHSKEIDSRVRRESAQDVYCMVSPQGSPVPLSDSPPLFTPPYSPDSTSSPLQKEELSHDLLLDVQGYTDELLSSPEGSPSYYCYPEAAVLTCQLSPSDSIPAPAEQTFDQASFATLSPHSSPSSSSSPSYDIPACTTDACLVPDCLSVSDRCDSPGDFTLHQDDFSLLQQPQEGSLHQVHQVPQHFLPMHSILLTPNQSPTSATTEQYNEKEQAEISILAQQISSLARSFDKYGTLTPLVSCSWPHQPLQSSSPPLKHDLVLDDGVFDSILKDLDIVTRKSSTLGSAVFHYNNQQDLGCSENDTQCLEKEPPDLSPTVSEDSLPVSGVPMDPFSLQLGCHDRNIGLYQLNRYMQCSLQQDGRGE